LLESTILTNSPDSNRRSISEIKISVLSPTNTAASIVAIDLDSIPNTLRFLVSKKFLLLDASFKLLETYHVPAEALNTASLVLKTSNSELNRTRNRNSYDAGVPFVWYSCLATLIVSSLLRSVSLGKNGRKSFVK